jgi:hypothetical protein
MSPKKILVGLYHWIAKIACGILVGYSGLSETLHDQLEVISSRCEWKIVSLLPRPMMGGSDLVIKSSRYIRESLSAVEVLINHHFRFTQFDE